MHDVPGVAGVRLTLLTRAYCHLCDDMREALAPLAAQAGAIVVEFDVDGTELCHFTLDAQRVRQALARPT